MSQSTSHTNWDKCCLCQTDSSEKLISTKAGYFNIAQNIPLFHAINALPIPLNPARLNEGEGIEETLNTNNAKYHNSCRLLFNNTKLDRVQKRKPSSVESCEEIPTKVRRMSQDFKSLTICFLCEKHDSSSTLRQAMTMKLNERLNRCATTLEDGKLLAKLSAGDVVAQELKYHPACLTALYNRERAHMRILQSEQSSTDSLDKFYPLAFSELIIYIMDMKVANEETNPIVFRLADLVSLYKERLQQLGVLSPEVNSTRLKEQILSRIPELESYQKGRDILLAFKKDVSSVLSDLNKYSEAIHLAKAAHIIRKEMLNHKSKFENEFNNEYVEESIPSTLLQLVCSIEHGVDIKSHLANGIVPSDFAMAQLLQYNCYAKYRAGSEYCRHSKDRETPFAVYIGLLVFAKVRKKQLIDILHEHGICISYDRVLEISAQLGESVINQYFEEGVVCPPVLRKYLFTTAAMDNIDHNPSATTATTSFHGTSISLFQHPTFEIQGEIRPFIPVTNSKSKQVPELPESFSNVPPAFFKTENPQPSEIANVPKPVSRLANILIPEYDWLQTVYLAENINDEVNISWSAFHASQKRSQDFEISITSLLPLLRDQAHSVATIKHVLNKVKDSVAFLNPGQTPVITADQPLFALAKQIQWHWPDQYGEDKVVIMFGGLHIEMTALKSIGSLLEDSGWTSALVEADIASAGTADSFLSASSVTKTRQAHQITACSLYKLLKEAYDNYEEQTTDEHVLTFENWRNSREQQSPQFQFWCMVLQMELIIMTLVRSFREADFKLYKESLYELMPYLFANNNVKYARWLSVHLRDMLCLADQHPEVARQFHGGNFVVHKSDRNFSAVAIDQAHEQNNAIIKGDGGAVGLTEDEKALRRWMVAGPEVSRLVSTYETVSGAKDATKSTRHHEEGETFQHTFFEKTQKLTTVMREMGNPFEEESEDLLVLDTKDIADASVSQLMKTHYHRGKTQFDLFMSDLCKDASSFYVPIKKNCIKFFDQRSKSDSKITSKVKLLKDNYQLFSRLFISCQNRQCDLKEFFKHENQSVPASLSDGGKLRTCSKSDLIGILQETVMLPETKPEADAIMIDGSALINSVPPRGVKTFQKYATDDILPKIQRYSSEYKRTDLVFDVYRDCSLKSEARSRRGKAVRRRVTSTNKTPSNWRSFLRDNSNKTELFNFLADRVSEISTANTVVVTKEEQAMTSKNNEESTNLDQITPCTHEEADTRLLLHTRHAVECGYKSIIIEANDTDIVVIAVSFIPHLSQLGLEKLWVTFGKGSKLRWIPVHDVASIIGQEKTRSILFFHAFSGCDVVSAFHGKGKKTAWQTWNVFPEASTVFGRLSDSPLEVTAEDMATLERFVVLMYDRALPTPSVNEARLELFARKQKPYDMIPPTVAALKEHVKRAAFQAGHIWGQSLIKEPESKSPSDWGWMKQEDNTWKVFWSSLVPIAKSCQELTKCGCKRECIGRCKCYSFSLACTKLCSCPCQS